MFRIVDQLTPALLMDNLLLTGNHAKPFSYKIKQATAVIRFPISQAVQNHCRCVQYFKYFFNLWLNQWHLYAVKDTVQTTCGTKINPLWRHPLVWTGLEPSCLKFRHWLYSYWPRFPYSIFLKDLRILLRRVWLRGSTKIRVFPWCVLNYLLRKTLR